MQLVSMDLKIKLDFGSVIPDDFSIRVFDALGNETGYRGLEKGDNYLDIYLKTRSQGIFFVNYSSAGINNTYKVIVVGKKVD